MAYSLKKPSEIFIAEQISIDTYLESIRDKDIWKYRVKTITSGFIREVEVYPVFKTPKAHIGAAAHKGNESSKAQKYLNYINKVKYVTRLLNCNFWDKDMWATFTYDNENLPTSEKQAQSNIKNYIRRLKAYIKKHGLPNLKYIYVTEYIEDSNKGGRVHHHIVMNFKDRDIAEKMWNKGNRKQTRRLQPDENGLEGLARYILKEGKDTETRKHSKSYFTSKGLEKPKETKSDYKITKRKVSNIAKDENGAKAIFETMNKGYKFNDLNVKYSEYVSGIYMYARMKKAPVKNNKKKRRN